MKGAIYTAEKKNARTPNSVGSSRIRGTWLMRYWPELTEYMIGGEYEFCIFQKAWHKQLICGDVGLENGFEGIKIFDSCDPDWLEREDAFEFYNACDAVTCSTKALQHYIQMLLPDKIVKYIPDRVDLEEHKNVKATHRKKLTDLVWFGYSHNFHYIQKSLPVLKKHGIRLTVYSDTAIQLGNADDRLFEWRKYDYERLHDELIRFDAAIFSSEREKVDHRGRFKSPNKQITCKALGIPVIHNEKELKLMMDVEARKKAAKAGRKWVEEEMDVKQSVVEYKKLIEEIKSVK